MRVFTTNYHISVNKTLIDDLSAIGLEVLLPTQEFAKGHISFYAPNDEHAQTPNVRLLNNYEQLVANHEPMVILIPCMQLIDDFMQLYKDRGERDIVVYLTANSDSLNHFPVDGTDYLITHDLDFHRKYNGKYKMLYFNRPTVLREKKTHEELVKSFEQKKLKLYINNFDKEGFEPEYASALELREKYGREIPFYGYDMPDGWLTMPQVQDEIVDSMFTVVFKRRETWGQMVNESMLLGTPCIFLEKYIYSTFKEYLINKDTAIVEKTVDAIVEAVNTMTFEHYETLVNEAYSQSQMFCNDEVRREKLRWLFSKIALDSKML